MNKSILKILGSIALLSSTGVSPSVAEASDAAQARRTKLRQAVQEICPVSGKALSTEQPAHSIVDPETNESLYVCCKGCTSEKADPKLVEKIHANFARAQKICLVMKDNEVTEKSKSAVIEGHRIFICCPPCTKKMNASPEKYLTVLDDLYESAIKK